MGYTTTFTGAFTIEPPLTLDQINYVNKWASTRRMAIAPSAEIDASTVNNDSLRIAVGLPWGVDGEFCSVDFDTSRCERSKYIADYNTPPTTQPGLWCDWCVSDDGSKLMWNEAEKFYHYEEWLIYMIENFFKRWGRTISGVVLYQGEDPDDRGALIANDNNVKRAVDIILRGY